MQDPAKFREYAAECRRMMSQATPENRQRLLVIAEAWDRCARDAENAAAKGGDGKSAQNDGQSLRD